ncbi:hypothetical protein AC1031_015955 [Aphanomyces cochlioides]|nr:hypothetical protein AC1031_015955 [Aphanomyces cochlioides]
MAEAEEHASLRSKNNDTAGSISSDPRVEFIRRIVESTFRSANLDALRAFFTSDATTRKVAEFIASSETRTLLVSETAPNKFAIYTAVTPALAGRDALTNVLYILKTMKGPVSAERYTTELIMGTLNRGILETMSRMMTDIFVPLATLPANQLLWPEMVATSVSENIQTFMSSLQITLGQTKGETCLPLPPETKTSTEEVKLKDQVHVLEGCLITWTKQIKNILKLDPEMLLNTQDKHNPGPSEENRFWISKARNLNSIFDQLQSESIRKVLAYLDASKSTYNLPFAKLCKEVFHARAEANDNVFFLAPLLPWFDKMENEADFTALVDLFRPMMHSILLVWKWSRFYNTPPRLVVLIRQICNELIRKARNSTFWHSY